MVAREIIIRKEIIDSSNWQSFFIISFCLGFGAFYELIAWWVALISCENAETFLGTQGYVWGTKSDMAMALFGSILALVTLRKLHDRPLHTIKYECLETRA